MAQKKAEEEKRLDTAPIHDAHDVLLSEEELRDLAVRNPPLVRDEEHSFVPAEDTDVEDDPELVQPDLTGGGNAEMAALEAAYVKDEGAKSVTLQRQIGRIKSEKYEQSGLTAADLERMSDAEIKASGILKAPNALVHPARLSPSSDRPRGPGQRAPAAGPGTWPVPEEQLPAVMPSDPPIEDDDDVEARELGDRTFAGITGWTSKAGGLSVKRPKAGTVLDIPKNRVGQAAAIYLTLKQQFPQFTEEQINDEFILRYESGIGEAQSHRAADELSQHGLTAVGDDRVNKVMLGAERAKSKEAFEADPEQTRGNTKVDSGLPSENEPASVAPDMAKKPSGETAAADAKAVKGVEKFDHDGNGAVGGSKKKTT